MLRSDHRSSRSCKKKKEAWRTDVCHVASTQSWRWTMARGGTNSRVLLQMSLLLTLSFPASLLHKWHIRGHPAPCQQLVPPWPPVETHTASLHQHPNRDAWDRPQRILRSIRSGLLDALLKQPPLPSSWDAGKQHAAELGRVAHKEGGFLPSSHHSSDTAPCFLANTCASQTQPKPHGASFRS